ncbi:MAG TPA: formylglycine-generating enzyme family protein, partial [Armatimonadota bacterium]|nr:formylglycine-generating enzyme family protein [Armatimonadota bacterium]
SKGFWLGKHEVTNARFRLFTEQTERPFPADSTDADDHPVRGITWTEAIAYCRRAGATLPSEAQWEYAARATASRWFPWGDFWESSRCCYREHKGPAGTTMPADANPDGASWCGALNLAGNVMEWCADWHDSLYYEDSPETDPTGPTTGEYRVLRGGCLGDLPWACRSSFRGNTSRPYERNYGVGLRICITP